jgi:hypothetical protein
MFRLEFPQASARTVPSMAEDLGLKPIQIRKGMGQCYNTSKLESMKLPRHAEIWFGGYIRDRVQRLFQRSQPKRVWITFADHFEPFWNGADDALAHQRVTLWRKQWPEVAARSRHDSAGKPPQYTFFYPEEEYRPDLMDSLAEMVQAGIADVEVHIHHDREGRQNFIDRMSKFCEVLHQRHGLLRRNDGHITFGFIHGNWALDNSFPGGRYCGLNDEITILRDLGCYADFTMPSGSSPSQSKILNSIYWCTDDPNAPKSYDEGVPATVGGGTRGDLLMVVGPMGLRWRERLMPRMETGEVAVYDLPTPYRVCRWFDLAPRLGEDIFIKLYTHGTQERHSGVLLNGALEQMYELIAAEAEQRGWQFYFVTAWEMFRAINALMSPASSLDLTTSIPGPK